MFGDVGSLDGVTTSFSDYPYVQLHANFIQDQPHLDSFVCFCNDELPKRKKYEQFTRTRSFKVWFTNFDGTPFVWHSNDVRRALESEPTENVRVAAADDLVENCTQEYVQEAWKEGDHVPVNKNNDILVSHGVDVNCYVYSTQQQQWLFRPKEETLMQAKQSRQPYDIRYTSDSVTTLHESIQNISELNRIQVEQDTVTRNWTDAGKGGTQDQVKEGSTVISFRTRYSYVYNERLRRWVWLPEPRIAHFVLELMLEY
jgi:hypothetical protein